MSYSFKNMDCVEGMKQYPDGYFDLCLTDPPYGIDLGYNSFDDSDENLKKFISVFMPEILRVSKRALITCGTKKHTLLSKTRLDIVMDKHGGNRNVQMGLYVLATDSRLRERPIPY